MAGQGTVGVGYTIEVSLGALFLIMILITIACYICNRMHSPPPPSPPSSAGTTTDGQDSVVTIEAGFDEPILLNYPKLLYSQAKLHNGDSSSFCCSICLADYKDTDMLRLLPDCGHFFHLQCVDPWFRLHSTCPICRDSLRPTPLAVAVSDENGGRLTG